MFFTSVNWLAVVAAAVASMALGFVWFLPAVFGNAWMKEIGKSPEELQGSPTMYLWTFLGSIVTAIVLAVFLGTFGANTWLQGLVLGLIFGLGFVATALGSHAIFHNNTLRHYLINAGYYVVNLAVMGLIIGAL